MMSQKKWVALNEVKFALISSIIITILTFAVFLGQFFWSDIVTFQRTGDNLKQCFPAFLKALEYIQNGQLLGIDGGTFNGATEFFYRSNLPNMYPFVWIAAVMMNFVNARGVYMLFYMCHLLISTYFAQRLANKFFGINKWFALLFAVGVTRIATYEMWYLSHFIIASLVCPLLYSSLQALQNEKKYKWILFSFPYVLAFTSGYITLSVMLAGFSCIFVLIYGITEKKHDIKTIILRSFIPPVIAGMVSVLYCFQLLIYMKDVVQNASSTLHDALYFTVNIKDIVSVFSGAFINVAPMEQLELITLGAVWIIVIMWIIKYQVYKKNDNMHFLINTGVGLNAFFLLSAFGILTPLVTWFYAFVPVFGSMHLQMRYMIITLPILYLALCKAISYVPDQQAKRVYVNIGICAAVGIFLLCILSRFINLNIINTDKMVLELIFLLIICFVLYNYGIGRSFALVCCCAIFFPALTWLYEVNEVQIYKSTIEERSIVYNEKYQETLDTFVGELPQRERYKYAMYNSVESVPDFIPGNYEWYRQSEYKLSNYMGYEIQLCVPADYSKQFWWFDQMDWSYILDTRGDFLVLDNASVEKSQDVLDVIVDWDSSNTYIDNTHRILKLKKYVPTHYTDGILYQESDEDTLDNGYFYSKDLENGHIQSFSTDDATYYQIKLKSEVSTDLAFLLYPNRYYHYFVDGKEIEPIIEQMRVYIPLESGTHDVEIKYVNRVGKLANNIYLLYYVILCISLLFVGVKKIKMYSKR